jgi:hypothetical protein
MSINVQEECGLDLNLGDFLREAQYNSKMGEMFESSVIPNNCFWSS